MLQIDSTKMLLATPIGYSIQADNTIIYDKKSFEKALSKYENNEVFGSYHYKCQSPTSDYSHRAKIQIKEDGVYASAIILDTLSGLDMQRKLLSNQFREVLHCKFIPVCECEEITVKDNGYDTTVQKVTKLISIDAIIEYNGGYHGEYH